MAYFLLEVQLPHLENKAGLSSFFLENVKQAKKMAQITVTNTEAGRRPWRQMEQQCDKSPLGYGAEKSGREGQGTSPGFSFHSVTCHIRSLTWVSLAVPL